MKVKYIGRYAGVQMPDVDTFIEHGETIEVSETLGKSLLEQPANWEKSQRQNKKSEEDVKSEKEEDSE